MLFNMEHPRNTEKKRISEKYYLRGIGSPISRIVRDEVYKTDGEYFIVVKDVENWFQKYTMTCAQSIEFRKYAYKYIKKALYLNKHKAESEIGWFTLQYGLKLSDPENFIDVMDYIKN